jgi:type I restriction enzyme S subunit
MYIVIVHGLLAFPCVYFLVAENQHTLTTWLLIYYLWPKTFGLEHHMYSGLVYGMVPYPARYSTIHQSAENISIQYLYYALLLKNFDEQSNLYNSQISKSLNKTTLAKIKIPVPSQQVQERIVENLNKFIGNNTEILPRLVQEFSDTNLFKILLKEDYDTMALAITYTERILDYEKNVSNMYRLAKIACLKMFSSETKLIEELITFTQTGKTIDKSKSNGKLYPYFGTGGITGKTDEYMFNGQYLLFSQDGSSGTVQK